MQNIKCVCQVQYTQKQKAKAILTSPIMENTVSTDENCKAGKFPLIVYHPDEFAFSERVAQTRTSGTSGTELIHVNA